MCAVRSALTPWLTPWTSNPALALAVLCKSTHRCHNRNRTGPVPVPVPVGAVQHTSTRAVALVALAGYIALLSISCMQMSIAIMGAVICLLYTEPLSEKASILAISNNLMQVSRPYRHRY